jgi:uncharacterized protein YwlG (UPF0340 family)
VTPEITAQLLATASHKVEGEGILATQLCSHMQDANLINTSRLNSLTGVLLAVLPTLHTSLFHIIAFLFLPSLRF